MNILAIGAHFDDIELGCAGALLRHKSQGDKVFAFVATQSGFTSPTNATVRENDTAQKEGIEAMKILGVELFCGAFPTLHIEFNDQLNVEILKIIEKEKIDLVYTHWQGDIHHDHQAVSKASLHSARHVPKLLMYRSNWYHSTLEFRGNFYVNISPFWDKKEEAIKAHVSELERTGHKWISFFKNEALNAGQRIGVHYAEVFEVIKWLEY